MTKSYRRKNKIAGQFSARTIEMMESPAFTVLSLSGHRVLFRIEIEHANHGGQDNGQLPITYDQFHDYGLDRHAISRAIREVEALGFIEITERGRSGNAEYRRPNRFRLTYRHTGRANPTDEWRRIKTIKEAKIMAQTARTGPKRKHFPVGFLPVSVGETHTENTIFIVAKPPLRAQWGKPPLHLYLGVGVGEAAVVYLLKAAPLRQPRNRGRACSPLARKS
jgi:hypothetical protein